MKSIFVRLLHDEKKYEHDMESAAQYMGSDKGLYPV
jgi:hypothetical protein